MRIAAQYLTLTGVKGVEFREVGMNPRRFDEFKPVQSWDRSPPAGIAAYAGCPCRHGSSNGQPKGEG